MKEELGPSACLEHDLLLVAQFELQVLKNEVKHGKKLNMARMLLAQRLQSTAGCPEALGLHKNLMLFKNGQEAAICADAKSGGCR